MRLFSLPEILKLVSEADSKAAKIEVLKKHDNPALRKFLELTFHPNVKWLLPEGMPSFTPCQIDDQEGRLYNEMRRMYLFIEGGGGKVTQERREELFTQILESMPLEDAQLLCSAKEKKLPYRSITPKLIKEAFPGLLP